MSPWQNVATSNIGRALQDVGAIALHWLKLLCGVLFISLGAILAFFAGWALLEPDKNLPRVVRHVWDSFVEGYRAAYLAHGLVPSDVPTIRNIALSALIGGLLLAAFGFVEILHWHLDRRE